MNTLRHTSKLGHDARRKDGGRGQEGENERQSKTGIPPKSYPYNI